MHDATHGQSVFVEQLRHLQPPGDPFELRGADNARTDADPVNPADNVARKRGLPEAAADKVAVVVAVGQHAARQALQSNSDDPLLLALLSPLEYEAIDATVPLARTRRRVAVLLRDPPLRLQLALIEATFGRRPNLGVIAGALPARWTADLQRAAEQWTIRIEHPNDPAGLSAALGRLLPASEALLFLPDQRSNQQAAALVVLRSGAAASVPVFGATDGLVRSGALAAVTSTPTQLAVQAQHLTQWLTTARTPGVRVVDASALTVHTNATVARSLHRTLPAESALSDAIEAAAEDTAR